MSLPLKPLPLIERWDCHQCGICCRGSVVPLSDDDLARLRAQHWEEHPDFRGTNVMVRQSWLGHDYVLAHKQDGSCVFLMPDGLCRIHKEHGFDAKPLACRMFPLQVVPREKSAVLTIRRACPSAAADKGRPVEEQLDFARQLAKERGLLDQGAQPPPIKPGERRDWRVTRQVLEAVQELLTDDRYPPVRRIVHALIFCRLLEQAQTRPMSDSQVGDLLGVLLEHIEGEVGDLFSSRQPPSRSAGVLFRQTAAEYVRLHPRYHIRPDWLTRVRLAWAAWAFVRGRGKLPRLHPHFPPATFEQLETPLGRLAPEIYQPLARFVETTAASWSYALSNRGSWSVIESLRQLALTYPIGLWLLRWAVASPEPGASREPAVADVLDIVTALDRGQGYAPLSGGAQRQRLKVLISLDELTRLVAWYGR